MKRTTSLILALAMVISILFGCNIYMASAATSGSCGGSCTWSYDAAATTLTISGTGAVNDYGASTIGISSKKLPWHDYRHDITKVVVEEGITRLGQLNFYNCDALTTVELPSTLTEIAGSVLLGVEPESDGYGAFRECTALTTIKLPENLTTIGIKAFQGCTALKSITFPDSLTSIGNYAFLNCTNLEKVKYGTGLTSTGKGVFYNAGVKEIEFSSTITAIDQWCFFGCKMTAVEIPESVTSIGTRAFANCPFLLSATVYNANCEFQGIVGEDPFNGSSQSLIIYGHSGSTAQTYAESKGYQFVSIDPCEHLSTHEVITVEPTCIEGGTTTQVCDNCGFVKSTTALPANGHSWEVIDTDDQTTENGHVYTYSKCSACQEEKTEIEHVSYVEGFYEYTNTSTCTKAGIETYTCLVENCGKVERKIVAKGNHNVETYTVTVEPTCTQEGSKEGVCTVCNEQVTESVPALGHTNELTETLDNTTEDGHIHEIYTCTVCNEQTINTTHVEWVEGNYTSTVIVEPKCVINGSQRDVCTVCSKSRLVTIPANGQHDWYVTSQTEPTCTAVGKIYYACNNCNLTKSENIDALGHDYVLIEESSTEPTCTAAGYNTYRCSRCAATNKEVVNAVGHTVDETNYTIITEPDCENDGSAVSVCTVCNTSFDIVLTALGHNYENVVVPIEDKPGHSLSTPTCTRCGATTAADTVHDEWLEGYYTNEVITEGNCTVARITRDTCTLCKTTRNHTTPAPGHNYSYTGTSDTGMLTYTCSTCQNVITRNPSIVLVSWNSSVINKSPSDVLSGYLLEINEDGILNAKDYALIKSAQRIAGTNTQKI